ncbi:MAG: uroporphyrinogen-III synthase, partial [Bryobacteraceae bacterium]
MRKLEGMRVVVTRAAHQAEELARPLRALGAEAILVPVIGIAPPAELGPLKEAAARAAAGGYDWIVFTSANAVAAFAGYVADPRSLAGRIAAIGAATGHAAQEHGFRVSLVPDQYIAESLVAALGVKNLRGRRILIPSAPGAREVLPAGLRERGAQVDVVEAYRNILPDEAKLRAPSVFREPFPDWVMFASSSAVSNLARIVGAEVLERIK